MKRSAFRSGSRSLRHTNGPALLVALVHVPPDEFANDSRAIRGACLLPRDLEPFPERLVDADRLPRRASAAPPRHDRQGVMTIVALVACMCHDTSVACVMTQVKMAPGSAPTPSEGLNRTPELAGVDLMDDSA